jgi:hypothetical protein
VEHDIVDGDKLVNIDSPALEVGLDKLVSINISGYVLLLKSQIILDILKLNLITKLK